MAVLQANTPAEATKQFTALMASGGTLQLGAGASGWAPNIATPFANRITIEALETVDDVRMSLKGPVQFECGAAGLFRATKGRLYFDDALQKDIFAPSHAMRLNAFTDVIFGSSFRGSTVDGALNNGISTSGPGTVRVLPGASVSDALTSCNFQHDRSKPGDLLIYVDGLLDERRVNDGFNLVGFTHAEITNCRQLDTQQTVRGMHQDCSQAWAKGRPNGTLIMRDNVFDGWGQGIYNCDDQKVAAVHGYAYERIELTDNDITIGAPTGYDALEAKLAIFGGNKVHKKPGTLFGASWRAGNCDQVITGGNVIDSFTDDAGRVWPGYADKLPWPLVPALDKPGILLDLNAALAKAQTAQRQDVADEISQAIATAAA